MIETHYGQRLDNDGAPLVGQTKRRLIAMDLSAAGKGGGPYTSHYSVMNSALKETYDFCPIVYRTDLGRFISIKRILDLRQQLRVMRPDVVHFSGLQLAGIHFAIACRLAGIRRTIVVVRGFSGDALDIGFAKRAALSLLIEPLTLLLTRRAYGVSKYVSERRIMRWFGGKTCGFIHNLPPVAGVSTLDRTQFRSDFGIADKDIVVVSVGRVTTDKGFRVLADAILNCSENTKLKFLIVGIGGYLEAMKDRLQGQVARGSVVFTGFRNDVGEILPHCDIFVLPTLHETLSNALLEASVAGLPLIASNTGGVPEIVFHGHNGLLTQPGNPGALVTAIMLLASSAELRSTFGAEAKRLVGVSFDRDRILRQIDGVYQSLLAD